VDVHVECVVADYFCLEGVVLFEGNSVVDQLCKRLVRGKGKFLLFSQCRMGVGISISMEGTEVDGAVVSAGEEELWKEHVKVVMVEGSDSVTF